MKAQEGHEGEVKAQEEQGENANSLQEESHVSNRHMTWWHNAWCVRVNNGPHLRTARDRRRVWRAATRAAQEVRDTGKVAGEKGRNGRREAKKATQATRCTSYCTYPNSNKHDRRSSNNSSTAAMRLSLSCCSMRLFLIDSVLGVVRMEAEGCDCLQEFPIVLFPRWWNCVCDRLKEEAD